MLGKVLLINTNITRPLVNPIGLEYVGESLLAAGISVQVLDLSFESDWKSAVASALKDIEPVLIGVSVRNTDDCSFASRKSFLPWISDVVVEIRRLSQSAIFLGGTGFSTVPETVLEITQADGGLRGDGEEATLALVKSLSKGDDFTHIPNVVYRREGKTFRNPTSHVDPKHLPLPRRRLFDNRSYEHLGGMVGIETKRGCPQDCIFCADPIVKGKRLRLRPPNTVVTEFRDLLDQGVSWFHLCDSEFNLPITHAKETCLAIIENDLGDRLHWYCYCSPVPFDVELAYLMKRAGCAGINFGIDSLCDEQLYRLGRTHSIKDIIRLVEVLRKHDLNYIFDLLFGGPGETKKTIETTIQRAIELDIPLVGVATGVRVYPETPLGKAITNGVVKEGLYTGLEYKHSEPLFYLSPSLGDDPLAMIRDLVSEDQRFLVLSAPGEAGSYNYADDDVLSRLIQQGARGAYWDIIRQSHKTQWLI
jgi:radical SAM superfamily enzyme YgiQ (UPF0313 family)